MKICPRCKSEVEDNFDMCWSCQYSFPEDRVFKESDFELQCPACNTVIDQNLKFCPVCNHDLNSISENNHNLNSGRVAEIDCLRCKIPMINNVNSNLHEGSGIGAIGELLELVSNRESFDVYFCPKCGKVEFFLSNVGN